MYIYKTIIINNNNNNNVNIIIMIEKLTWLQAKALKKPLSAKKEKAGAEAEAESTRRWLSESWSPQGFTWAIVV